MRARVAPALMLVAGLLVLGGCGESSGTQDAADAVETATSTSPPPQSTAPEAPSEAEPTPPRPRTITIRVVGGRPQGGIARPSVRKNEQVVIIVRSDVADEIHLHGYDVSRAVAAGGTARIAFKAKIPGRFELELEERGVQLGELTVR